MVDGRDRHGEHDPMLIATLLDGDLAGSERTAAASRIAACPDCAALHADLLALSSATRALPTPPRPRDFTLTAADAARLRAPNAGELPAAPARLAGVMTDLRTSASHASHDTILVASLADHSLAPAERAAAEALVAACGPCAALHADLLSLRAATRAMPTPSRPRDYTLTVDDAVRLRPGGWRRFIATLGTSRDAVSRPLAFGLTSLGLAGLLVATVPSMLHFGSAGAASAPTAADQRVGAPAVMAAPGAAQGGSAEGTGAPSTPGDKSVGDSLTGVTGAAQSARPVPAASGAFGPITADRASPTPGSEAIADGSSMGQPVVPNRSTPDLNVSVGNTFAADSNGVSTLVVLSGVFLIAGLGLFLIRWMARRLASE